MKTVIAIITACDSLIIVTRCGKCIPEIMLIPQFFVEIRKFLRSKIRQNWKENAWNFGVGSVNSAKPVSLNTSRASIKFHWYYPFKGRIMLSFLNALRHKFGSKQANMPVFHFKCRTFICIQIMSKLEVMGTIKA